MSQQGSNDPTQAQVSSTGRIDLVCDQFEKACQAGKPPLIEEVLLQVPPDERDRLLGELLEIELDFRQRSGTFLQLEAYRDRFPECAEQVESVFRRVVKTRRLGDYELLEELGRGGMGVVYKARQVYLNQTVALKILPHRYLDDEQAVNRFRREMQSIGGLDHPNIVRAYNAGEAGGVQFLVMEFANGANLQQFVGLGSPPGGPLGVGAACEIIRQAALGLQHAYEHQLVHRDIKPANLMLCRNGQVKLLDLGLAKFHAERGHHVPMAGNAQPQGRLTQPGVTMGTIDYMAPEQWENSATADIRSDIYSLGCTLFFLLTGKPPYGDPAYDTNRKKLMAHVVAPIPSLVENCPDCPQDLEEVYETMLAKDPRERYAVPAEVAEAVEEFADAEELAEVIAAMAGSDAWAAASRPELHSPEADTAKKQGAGSVGSNAHRRTQSRRIAKKFRRNVQLVLLGSLLAVVSGLLAWVVMRPQRDGAKIAGHSSAAAAVTPATPPSTEPPISRKALAAELALLPGLNGPWWFEETPWLTPFLREAITGRVLGVGQADQGYPVPEPGGKRQAGKSDLLAAADLAPVLGPRPLRYLSSNTAAVQKWLWEAAGRCRGDLSPVQWKLVDQLKAFSDGSRDDDQKAAHALDDALQQFIEEHGDADWPAADLHAKALLQHRIAVVRSDASMAKEAKASYEFAVEAYAAEKETPASTRLLCLADEAILCAGLGDDMKQAKQRLDAVLAERDLPLLFHVSTLVARGNVAEVSATSAGEYEDQWFTYAGKLLARAESIEPSHPLAAYIAESFARSLMDQWKVEEAGKQFQDAHRIRLTNQETKNPFAAIHVFHDRQGSAMASRYRGNLDSARRNCRSIVEEVKTALVEAQRHPGGMGQRSYVRALRQRLSRSRECLADCELYSGAASDGRVNLGLAAETYEAARTTADDWSESVALGAKQAIMLALNGRETAARDLLDALAADKRPVLGPSAERAALALQVAGAAVAIKAMRLQMLARRP